MTVEMLCVGALGTNAYLIINEEEKKAIIVDPGGDGDKICARLQDKSLDLVAVFLTHGHCDHTDGLEDIKSTFPDAVVYAHKNEKETLLNHNINLSSDVGYGNKSYSADVFLDDEEIIEIAGIEFKVLATPGHTAGGCCYYAKNENVLFSGDTLFAGSIGRTDFPGGSMDVLIDSIKSKLLVLPDDTAVLPGHMGTSTIGREKAANMFLR